MNASPGQSAAALEREVADLFDFGAAVVDVQPLGRGLINDTYVVSTNAAEKRRAVLQRINQRAFPQPELIIDNLRALTEHARKHGQQSELRIPDMFRARDGKFFVIDHNGGFWRALSYIENTTNFETVANTQQAQAAGAALGQFHALVADLSAQSLHATRPRFHKTPAYFDRFNEVAAQSAVSLDSADLKWCADFIEKRRDIVPTLEGARDRGELKLRVIHGDPKLDNFLFDATGKRVVSLIDLDTVQPGLIHYDIGDCLRSCANPVGETPAKLDDVRFDLDICRALLTSYLGATRVFLTPADYRYIYDAIRLIPFELGLRFLTDHLENDAYFKVQWRGHNLHRAMAQFRLVADIENKESDIRALISHG